MQHYYEENINDFINILEVLTKNRFSLNNFSEKDRYMIINYIHQVSIGIVKDYFKALNTVSPINSKYIKLVNLVPEYGQKLNYDYSKVMDAGDYELNRSNINYDVYNYNLCLNEIINSGKLPKYCIKLNPIEVSLFIRAKAFYEGNYAIF